MKRISLYLFVGLMVAAACQPQFEMVPPGSGNHASEFSENWYVTRNGAGLKSGADWTNAISFATFLKMITDPSYALSSAAFHIQEGTYQVTRKDGYNALSSDVLCIRGGYSAALEYADLSLCNPDLYPTVFTGDADGNGTVGEGDGAFAYVSSGNIRFDNITFKDFYLSKSGANALGGKGSAVFGINGPYLSTSVECRNCIFEGNVNAVNDNAGREGGPCAFVSQGYFKAYNCVFRNNSANSRGGAVRTNERLGVLFLDRCLFTGNTLTGGSFGSAIQCSAGEVCMNNCTLVGNSGTGSTLNGGGAFLVVNSTIIDDAEPTEYNAAFRCESSADAGSIVINSVFSSSKAGGTGLILNNGVLRSGGFNLFKNVVLSGTGTDPLTSDDTVKDAVLAGTLESRWWKWDVAQVLSDIRSFAIVDDIYDTAVSFNPVAYCNISVLGRAYANWVTPYAFAKDARGEVRGDDRYQPGSYDPNID